MEIAGLCHLSSGNPSPREAGTPATTKWCDGVLQPTEQWASSSDLALGNP